MKSYYIIFSIALAAVAADGAASREQWERYAAGMREIPGLIRFYSFTSGEALQPDRAGGAEMKLAGAQAPGATVTEGRIRGMQAVVLDADSFRAPILGEIERDFTVALWIRPEGAGTRQTDGRVSGMICSSGSGYYDGWRLAVYDMERMLPHFEIGRGKNSVGLRSDLALGRGVWNHLAASWDGRLMRIFVNGMPAASQEFAGPHEPAKSGVALGYSGYGVGSLKMAADELTVFNRALSAGEIVALSLVRTALPDDAAVAVNSAYALLLEGQGAQAERELNRVAAGAFPPEVRLWAQAARFLQKGVAAQAASEMAALCALYDDPALPVHLKSALRARILSACDAQSTGIPSRTLERLPVEAELTEEQKFTCALALAESYLNENQSERAFTVFDHLISVSAHERDRLRDLRFRYARALREAGRGDDAAEHYLAVANSVQQPDYVRSIAALALARTLRDTGNYDAAISACEKISAAPLTLPHHRHEAQETIRECRNLQNGEPARDPEAYRRRPDPLPAPGLLFFVAPRGSDQNPGTRDRPFASLEKARDAIRALKKSAQGLPAGGATVYLRGGTYRMGAPLELSEEDSGSPGAPVVYAAWRDEKPVFDGGFEAARFRKVRDPSVLARLPREARGKVYAADLKSRGFSDFEKQQGYGYGVKNESVRSVYADGEFMPLARWPNDSRIPVDALLEGSDRAFKTRCDRLLRWTAADDLMADGFWYHLWAGEALHVERVDAAEGVITLAKKPERGFREGRPFYVMNLLEEIDQPGEWFIDRGQGVLYIWLKKHPWFTNVVVSERKQPFIRAEGVRDLVFRGIAFQYGQERAAQFSNCVNLSIIGCRFHGFGGTALLVLNAANAMIYGNTLDTLGHGGMHVSGGNRKNLADGAIHIENNEVGHFGLSSKTYVPAILLEGVGATVAHNWFHHAPSSAMRIEGNDHLIEYNLTEFVVRESDDQGGIDMWSNASYRGCVMRYNIWRDIGAGEIPCGQGGIRFDDAISGMVVYGNVFERSSNGNFGGVQIHGGHMNIIDNNLFIDCRYAVSFSPWSLERFRDYIAAKTADKLHKEVNIDLPPYSTRYPSLQALRDDAKHNVNSVWRNVITGTDTPWYRAPQGTDFIDNHLTGALTPGCALLKTTTFREIPLSEIGTYDDAACAR